MARRSAGKDVRIGVRSALLGLVLVVSPLLIGLLLTNQAGWRLLPAAEVGFGLSGTIFFGIGFVTKGRRDPTGRLSVRAALWRLVIGVFTALVGLTTMVALADLLVQPRTLTAMIVRAQPHDCFRCLPRTDLVLSDGRFLETPAFVSLRDVPIGVVSTITVTGVRSRVIRIEPVLEP